MSPSSPGWPAPVALALGVGAVVALNTVALPAAWSETPEPTRVALDPPVVPGPAPAPAPAPAAPAPVAAASPQPTSPPPLTPEHEPTPTPTPTPEPEPTPTLATSTPEPPTLALRFELDSAALSQSDALRLTGFANTLGPTEHAHVVCSTDPFGATWFNLELSKRRCAEVARLLIHSGLPLDRITTEPLGELYEPDEPPERRVHAPSRRVARVWRR